MNCLKHMKTFNYNNKKNEFSQDSLLLSLLIFNAVVEAAS